MKKQSLNVSSGTIMGIIVFLASFFLFYYAPTNVSYDYENYIITYNNITELTLASIMDLIEFPYIDTEGVGRFEILFVFILKALSLSGLSASAGLALINALSLAVKVVLLRKLGVTSIFILSAMVLTSITLFEFNAMRAGIAAAFILLSAYFWEKGNKEISLFIVALSPLFHLSALIYIVFVAIYKILSYLDKELKGLALLIILLVLLCFPFVFQFIPSIIIPEKIYDYIELKGVLSNSANYNPFNSISLILYISFIMYWVDKKNPAEEFYYFMAVLSSIFYVGFQFIPVVAERIWLLFYLFVFVAFSTFVQKKNNLIGQGLTLILFFSISINYLIRYPHANLLYFIDIKYDIITANKDRFERELKEYDQEKKMELENQSKTID